MMLTEMSLSFLLPKGSGHNQYRRCFGLEEKKGDEMQLTGWIDFAIGWKGQGIFRRSAVEGEVDCLDIGADAGGEEAEGEERKSGLHLVVYVY